MSTARLIDGREVATDSPEWRHECEARAIAALRTLPERRAWLEGIEKERGKAAADALRATLRALWSNRAQAGPHVKG